MKHLSINISLVEALGKMTGYTKFMKGLFTKKRVVSFETIENMYHCIVIAPRSLVEKKEELIAFTIPCTVRSFNFAQFLCDI